MKLQFRASNLLALVMLTTLAFPAFLCGQGVVINGKALSSDQLAELEKMYNVKAQAGSYWYDAKSGMYGVVGQPAYGFMYPNHKFGDLARDASAGNTGVIVNGRELPQAECGAISQDTLSKPLPAHAHNDYLHEHALLDALGHGFRSIEADVYSGGDSLYVAHDRKDIEAGRTLRSLYLEPLMEYFSDGEKSLYGSDHPLILLVDIKDHGLSTYKLLDQILQDYREILCHVSGKGYVVGRVMVVISGNRPIEYMMDQAQRCAFVDGRVKDLSEGYPPVIMPLISDRWSRHFSWKGKGVMPDKEKAQLGLFVQQAHENGQLIRFWATPDTPGKEREALWSEMLEAGVDLINTDDLGGLQNFLINR